MWVTADVERGQQLYIRKLPLVAAARFMVYVSGLQGLGVRG